MQRCFASITTATPVGCNVFMSASAICNGEVLLDLERLAKTSTMRATFESPITLPLGCRRRAPCDERTGDDARTSNRARCLSRARFRSRRNRRWPRDDGLEALPVAVGEELKGARGAVRRLTPDPGAPDILYRFEQVAERTLHPASLRAPQGRRLPSRRSAASSSVSGAGRALNWRSELPSRFMCLR